MFPKYTKIILFFIVLCHVFLFGGAVRGPDHKGPVKRQCVACICNGSSGCAVKQFKSRGLGGPLRITEPYWIDAGQPTIPGETANAPGAFDNCANDIVCSDRALQGYMERYERDCNKDGKIDCDDYAAIHRLGPTSCEDGLPDDFKRRYFDCKSILQTEKNLSF